MQIAVAGGGPVGIFTAMSVARRGYDVTVVEHDLVRGLVVDGAALEADVVVVATGRASRLGDEYRGPVEGGSCGFSYISRMYRARPGQPACELPAPLYATGPGYFSLVMPQ